MIYMRRNHFDYSKMLKRDYKAFVHFTNLLQVLIHILKRDTLLIVLDILVELYLDYEGSKYHQNLLTFVKFNSNVISKELGDVFQMVIGFAGQEEPEYISIKVNQDMVQ